MPDLATLARFAAANVDTDRAMLDLCMESAMRWFENAGVARRENDSLYDFGVYQLATHYLDNHGVVAENGTAEIPMGVTSIMHQLRLEDDTPAGTDDGGTIDSGGGGA